MVEVQKICIVCRIIVAIEYSKKEVETKTGKEISGALCDTCCSLSRIRSKRKQQAEKGCKDCFGEFNDCNKTDDCSLRALCLSLSHPKSAIEGFLSKFPLDMSV
jgi:hypothetical protein